MVELLERPRDVREPAVTREAVGRCGELVLAHVVAPEREVARLSPKPGGSVRGERANLKGLVLGCIEAKICK